MKPEDALNRVFHELDVRVDPRVDQRILRRHTAPSQGIDRDTPGRPRPMRWRTTMKYPVTKLAIAAAVIVAAMLGIHFFSGTSGTSWAAVLDKVNGFDTCVYRTRDVETTGPRPDGFEFATEGNQRTTAPRPTAAFRETYKNGEAAVRQYMLLQEKQHVSIYGDGPPTCVPARAFYDEEPSRRSTRRTPRRMIAKILAGDYVEIGEDIIEGKRVRGVDCEIRTCWPTRADSASAG